MITNLMKLDARIPSWDLNDLIERQCPFCKSDGDSRYNRQDSLVIKYCNNCSTFFVSPAPSQAQLNNFYSGYNKDHRRCKKYNLGVNLARQILQIEPFSDFRIEEIFSMQDLSDKYVLDVGFGLGSTLVCFKKLGAKVTGIELDAEVIDFAKKYLGILGVKKARLLELDANKFNYNLITLHDLIEHPFNPIEMLSKAIDLLKPGGLVSIFTPNASFAFEENEPILFKVDLEHMQYLTFKTCLYISKVFALDIVHLESVGFPDLEGIDKLSTRLPQKVTMKSRLKDTIRTVPGFELANKIRKTIICQDSDLSIRRGKYHIFAIFKKVA